MTNQQILRSAIVRATRNGWDDGDVWITLGIFHHHGLGSTTCNKWSLKMILYSIWGNLLRREGNNMDAQSENTKQSPEGFAFEKMKEAFTALNNTKASRENSIAITNLEQAMMWCNKDRVIKGELEKSNSTHVHKT